MRVVVAMSGGVDSSVAAGLMVEAGHEVIGVHMRLHDEAPSEKAGHCCGFDDAMDARRVASDLDIPFYVLDLRKPFKKAVMDDLTMTYLRGKTPNPCIRCNGVLKFKVLMQRALSLGADALATGHYARLVREGGQVAMHTGLDDDKDQSYFLFPIEQRALAKTLFPIGELTKAEVRDHAERMGLVTAYKPESQEVCFLPDDDHTRFISEQRADLDASGEIVDEDGKILGFHSAYYKYTVGQRKGLGISLGVPAYVVRVEADTQRVVVSTDPGRLARKGMRLVSPNWFERPAEGEWVDVRIRHRGRRIRCTVSGDADTVMFEGEARAVAPGQAAVFYRGDRVLGGGWIEEPIAVG